MSNGKKIEYVYCAMNKFMIGILKIGKTKKFPYIRACELGNFTGCPAPFTLLFYIKVTDCHKYEKIIHNLLKNLRVNDSREFFYLEKEEASKYFDKFYLIDNGGNENDFDKDYLKICEERIQ